MTELLDLEADTWSCPRLSPHPPGRTSVHSTRLEWTLEPPNRIRVVRHTCSCRVIVYELLTAGGAYFIRRTHQTLPAKISYAGPWSHRLAVRLWALVLTGEAG